MVSLSKSVGDSLGMICSYFGWMMRTEDSIRLYVRYSSVAMNALASSRDANVGVTDDMDGDNHPGTRPLNWKWSETASMVPSGSESTWWYSVHPSTEVPGARDVIPKEDFRPLPFTTRYTNRGDAVPGTSRLTGTSTAMLSSST